MNEFDELLDRVLLEDANPQPPSGMEARIAASLSAQEVRHRKAAKIWYGVAATILAGLALWSFARSEAPRDSVRPSPAVSLVSAGAPLRAGPVRAAQQHTSGVRAVLERPRRSSRQAVRIAPLEIEPLVIQPIEIASLTSSTSTGKGEVR